MPPSDALSSGPVELRASRTVSLPPDILVVDDDPTNLLVIQQMLELAGYPVLRATNGVEAVETAARVNPKLILMDLSMPRMDGFEAASTIRRRSAVQPTIVAVTAHANQQQREACREAGFDGFLAKPVDMGELLSTVAALIQ